MRGTLSGKTSNGTIDFLSTRLIEAFSPLLVVLVTLVLTNKAILGDDKDFNILGFTTYANLVENKGLSCSNSASALTDLLRECNGSGGEPR